MHYMTEPFESADDIVEAFYQPKTPQERKAYLRHLIMANEDTMALPHAVCTSRRVDGGLAQSNSLFWIPDKPLDDYSPFEIDEARHACRNVNQYEGWNRFQLRRLLNSDNNPQWAWAMAAVNTQIARMDNGLEDIAMPMTLGAFERGADYLNDSVKDFKTSLDDFKANMQEYLHGAKAFQPEMKAIVEESYLEMNKKYVPAVRNYASIVREGSVLVRHGYEDTFNLSENAAKWATDPHALEVLTNAMKWCKLGFFSVAFEVADGGYEVYGDYKEGNNWAKKAAEVTGELGLGLVGGFLIVLAGPECLIAAIAYGAIAGAVGDHFGNELGDKVYSEYHDWRGRRI